MAAVPSTFDPVSDCPVTPYKAFIADDLAATLANGAAVASWPCSGSNGRPAVQSTGGSQPTFQSSDANFYGRGSVAFDGTADNLACVFGESVGAVTTQVVIARLTSSGAGTTQHLTDGNGASNRAAIYRRGASDDWSIYAGTAQHAGTPDTSAHCFVAKFTGSTTSTLSVDGAVVVAASNAGSNTLNAFRIGSDYAGANFAAAEIAAVLVFEGDVTGTAGWANYIAQLAAYYGVVANDTDTVSGNDVRSEGPIGTGVTAPLMIFCHGFGGSEDSIWNEARLDDYRQGLLANGWIVAGSNQDGANWGNADGQAAITELIDWVEDTYTVSKIMFVAYSMGGLGSLSWIASAARDPRTRGWVGMAAASDLADLYYGGVYTASIATAYTISGLGTDYLTQTEGFDPQLETAASFAGVRFLHIGSSGDTSVDFDAHGLPLHALIDGVARSSETITVTGNHVSDAHFEQDEDFAAFAATCLADEPPELTIQAVGLAGTTPTFEKADPNGDRVLAGDTVEVAVVNASGGAITVTFDSVRPSDQGTDEDVGGSVANGATDWFGPFPAARFADAEGYVSWSYSATTSVTVAATRV